MTQSANCGMILPMNSEPAAEIVALSNRRVVAVDGGTATGKGRLIEELSQLLRLKGVPVVHLSTGSLYRAVAWACMDAVSSKSIESKLDRVRIMPPEKIIECAQKRHLEMHSGAVWLNGEPAAVEVHLKGPGVGVGSSIVSIPVPVREFVNVVARRQVNEFDGYVLIDGRDTTNTVVPDAGLKLLLTVAPHVAAQRSVEHTIEQIIARDDGDRRKKVGALRHADDAGPGVIVLPTDDHTPESVRDHVYALMRKTWPELPEL